ncbi:hypothetical protein [Streptomyces sp. NPDC058770]|uniref:hypothetical protein n=1 Tax=unclassified Streptomyces TaxID=2593676 RepID=UPI0036A348D6
MSKVLRRPCTGPAVCRGPDLTDSEEWVLRLSSAQIGELEEALRTVRERSLPLLKVGADDFPLPALAGELERIAHVLDLLLLNNHAVLHSRTEYEHFADPERQRPLLRLWLALRKGRDLPPDFWGNLHGSGGGPGRGGITPGT